jgi:hypothetical protein
MSVLELEVYYYFFEVPSDCWSFWMNADLLFSAVLSFFLELWCCFPLDFGVVEDWEDSDLIMH